MDNEVENHGSSTETPTIEEPKKGWRKLLEGIGSWLSYKDKEKWLDDMRGNLGLIATVIATMTFQMVLNPPGGVWPLKDDTTNRLSDTANSPSANANSPDADIRDYSDVCIPVSGKYLCAGQAILGVVDDYGYLQFLIANTVCFISSLSICLLLVSGISLNHRFLMWLLSIGMCITLTSLALSYLTAVLITTPEGVLYVKKAGQTIILKGVRYSWAALLLIIGFCHILRLVIWAVTFFRKRKEKANSKKITKETPIC
jgi:hypothetical protein